MEPIPDLEDPAVDQDTKLRLLVEWYGRVEIETVLRRCTDPRWLISPHTHCCYYRTGTRGSGSGSRSIPSGSTRSTSQGREGDRAPACEAP